MRTRLIQRISVWVLVAYCLFSGWAVFEAFRSYTVISSAGIRDYDMRLVVNSCMDTARSWTAIIAVLSFFAGIAVLSVYQILRHDRVSGSEK